MTERDDAESEAEESARAASAEVGRPRIRVEATNQDITEEVVTILDALYGSMDWGSGFLTDEETLAAERLMVLLRFTCGAPVKKVSIPKSFWTRHPRAMWVGKCSLPYGHDGPHHGTGQHVWDCQRCVRTGL